MGGFKEGWGNCVKHDIICLKKYMNSVCPVNNSAPVIMSISTFRKICSVHVAKNVSPNGGWSRAKKADVESACSVCSIRESVSSGEYFNPPTGITIKEINTDGTWNAE